MDLHSFGHAEHLAVRPSRDEDMRPRVVALERLLDLGDPIDRPYVTVTLISDQELELRLISSGGPEVEEAFADSRLSWGLHYWLVRLYERGAANQEWSYEARVALDGTVTGLRRGGPFEAESSAPMPASTKTGSPPPSRVMSG